MRYQKPHKYKHEITSDEIDNELCYRCNRWFPRHQIKEGLCKQCRKEEAQSGDYRQNTQELER